MSTWSKLIAIVALAAGVLAAPGAALAAITITNTSSTVQFADGAPGASADGVLSGTDSFTITANPTTSVLVVNYTEFAQSGTGPDATTSIKWNGATLTPAIVESSSATSTSSPAYAEVFYLFNPTPAFNGSLVISGSGRDCEVGAYMLSGVTSITPSGYGNATGNGTVAVNFSSATPAGGFAAITGAFRENGNTTFTYNTSSGPAVNKQWTNSDASNPNPPPTGDMASCGAYVSNLSGGSVTVTQTDNAGSRDVLAAAVFTAAPTSGLAWSATGGGSWNLASNWGGTVPSGTDAFAQFTAGNPTTTAAITLDAAITVNSLVLANSNQITIGPGSGGSLTFAASGSNLPTVTVTAGSHIISAPVSLNANTILYVNSGLTLALNGNIADGTASSGISFAGGGTLILGGNNSYSGATSVAGGTISLQSAGAVTQNLLTIFGGGVLVETASNALSGSAALTVGKSTSVTLSQANNYTGATSVNGGTLQLAMPGSLYAGNSANWTPANVSVSGSGMLAVNIGGPNDFTPAQAATLLGNLSASTSSSGLAAGASFGFDTTNASATVAYSGQIADSTAGRLGVTKLGVGVLSLTNSSNSYSGPTLVTNGELILSGANTATAGTVSTVSAVNTVPAGTTVLSIRNGAALGSGTANSGLAPITLNATGGNNANSINDTVVLEIGAKIGTDPGPYNADFSYQVVSPGTNAVATNVVAGNGQINLGFLGNNDDGTGFAAFNANSLSTPRIVALYTPVAGSTTLATIKEKYQFGQGTGDHLTLGSPTANNTLVLENPVDVNGGPSQQFSSIRGVGIVPEGEYAGAIQNSANSALNISFNGNGGLIFDSAATSYLVSTIQINGGAVFVAANDPAQNATNGALGNGPAALQLGTGTATNPGGGSPVPTVAGANVAFMTYGPNAGIGSLGIVTNRSINVGGSDVTYASATLGGMTDDWTQMNGNISLNESPTTPTTFTAGNGGRVEFGGTISGTGSVVVGNSIVEGDAISPGIAVNNNGTIVFYGQNTYTGSTTVSAGKLYVNGAILSSSLVSVGSAATLGGTGSISSPVNVSSGGILEGGQLGSGTLTLSGSVTFNGPASVYFGGTLPAVGSPSLVFSGALNTNGNPVTINVASISGTGDYALIGYSGVQTSPSDSFTLGALPNRAVATLAFNNGANELDLDVTKLAAYILWTGSQSSAWNTVATNWTIPGGQNTQYIDSPGDAVFFDDSAAPRTNVTINGADVHPSSVTFNNNTSTYTISGSNAIAGSTGLQLTGTGTVVVLNTNTFTGATSIGAGATLQLGNGAAGNDGSISHTSGITDDGTLIYNLAGVQSYGGVISGTGSLALQSGMLTLTGSNTYSGASTISGGTLQLGTGAVNQDGSLAGNITNNSALLFNYFGSQIYAGVISGSGAVTKSGLGTLTLAANNSYSGATQVNGGTLQLASQGALQNSTVTIGPVGSLTFAGGITDFNIGGLAGSNGFSLTDSTSGNVALTVGGNLPNTVFSGSLSGSGSLIQAGPNSLTLSGTNSYSGGTTISGGTLAITNANSLGATGGLLTVGAGTLEVAGNITTNRNINFNDPAATIQVDASQSYNNTGTLSGGGNLTETGAGLLVLAGTTINPFSATVSGGTLLANGPFISLGTITVAAGVFGGNGGAGDTTVLNHGTIDVSANNGSTLSLSSLTLGQSSTDASALNFSAGNPAIPQLAIANTLTANGGNNSVTVNVGASGALIGTYTLATYSSLAGTGSSAFVLGSQSGLSSRDQGALLITGSAIDYVITGNYPVWRGTQGSNWIAANNWVRSDNGAPTTFLPGDTVVFDDSAGTTVGGTTNATISGTGNVSPSSVTFNNNAYNYTISGPYGIASGALTLNGTGSVTLSTSNTYNGGTNINAGTLIANNSTGAATGSGPVNINGGTLQIGNGGATGTLGAGLVNDNSVLAFSRSDTGLVFANTISGSGSVVQLGPGMTTLTATNSYSGGTTVSGGTLSISTDANLGAVPATSNSASIALNGAVLQITGVSGFNTATINANRGITLGASGGTIAVTTLATGTFNTNEAAAQYPGIISGTGNLTVIGGSGANSSTAPYLLELEGPSTYGGTTTINNATVSYQNGGNGNYVNVLPATTVLSLINNGWLVLNNNTADQTLAGLTGDATGVMTTTNQNFAANVTINPAAGQTYNFTGVIGTPTFLGRAGNSARLTLTISGQGTQILSGANTYSGGTTIDSGILQLGNSAALGTGALAVNGGTLDLHGFSIMVPSFSGAAGLITNSGTSNSLLTVNQGTTATTFSGTIGDGPTNKVALTLITSGTGELVLDGSNTYSGATIISGSSTLQLGDGDNTGSIGNSAVTDNGTLIVSRSDSVNLTSLISGTLSGSGALTLNGGGTLTLTGTNTYTGGTFVNSGTMIVTNPEAIEDGTSLTVGDASGFPAPIVPAPLAGAAVASVPEPGSLLLLAAGSVLLVVVHRLRHNKK